MKNKLRYPLFIMVFLFFIILPAYSHYTDVATIKLKLSSKKAEATLTLPTQFITETDQNRDGKITQQELTTSKNLIKKRIQENVYITNNGKKGDFQINFIDLKDKDNKELTFDLIWTWKELNSNFDMYYNLFPKETPNAKCLVSFDLDNSERLLVFDLNNKNIHLKSQTKMEIFKQLIFMGIEHIATGYDHILFLMALLLAGGNFKYLVKIVTSFTLAHSITLSLAVLNIIQIPSRISESFIALSIMYVAAENLWRKKDEAHWFLVFVFGLIHGVGFANVLQEMEINKNQLLTSLISFNLGIEMGQLVIVTLVWFLLQFLLKKQPIKYIKPISSIAIFFIATFWFIERVFSKI